MTWKDLTIFVSFSTDFDFVSICLHRARFLKYAVSWLGNVYLFYSAEVKTFKSSGAKSVFLNLSRDKLKNVYIHNLKCMCS